MMSTDMSLPFFLTFFIPSIPISIVNHNYMTRCPAVEKFSLEGNFVVYNNPVAKQPIKN